MTTENRYKDLLAQATEKARRQGPSRAELLLGKGEDNRPIARSKVVTKDEQGMNKTEAAYAVYLEALKGAGVIEAWWWDAITLKLGHDCRYRTDFLIQMPDGEIQLHETKGFMQDDALVKLKVCRSMFPFRLFLVKKDRKDKERGWSLTEYKPW